MLLKQKNKKKRKKGGEEYAHQLSVWKHTNVGVGHVDFWEAESVLRLFQCIGLILHVFLHGSHKKRQDIFFALGTKWMKYFCKVLRCLWIYVQLPNKSVSMNTVWKVTWYPNYKKWGEEKNGKQGFFLLFRSPPNFTILFFGCFQLVFRGHASSPSLFCAKLANSTSSIAKQQE